MCISLLKNVSHGALSFVIMWYSGQSELFDAFTIFLLPDKFKEDQRMKNGVKLILRYIFKRIKWCKYFIETWTALN